MENLEGTIFDKIVPIME